MKADMYRGRPVRYSARAFTLFPFALALFCFSADKVNSRPWYVLIRKTSSN